MFEKKRGKRFLASVMALVMLLSLAPVGALAAGETPTNEECSAMPLPAAEDDNKQAVADEDNNTPTPQPAVDPKPVVDTPENGETTNSDTENGVANLPLLDENRPVVDTSSTTEEEPTVDVGDVLYDLYDFNGRQPGGNNGYVWDNYTVTYDANLPKGASLISGVSLPDAQTVSTWERVWIKDLSGRNKYNRDAQVSGKNEYYKFLGWATTSDATTARYTPGQRISISSNTTLYAVWERNDKDVMYFVLMPGIDAPSNGADQGYQKYYPNKTGENDQKGDDGGVSGCTVYTGYTGGNLTETGFNAVPTEGDSVVDLAGQYSNSTYLSVPSDLGYFNANTKTDELNLNMTGKEIVWYVIKNQEDGYHVDGYVKNVPIKVRYHENFNGNTAVKDTVTGIVSGGTVTVKTAEDVFGTEYTHEGYTFAGWSTSQGEGGTVYQPGNQTEELVTSLDLYAKWEPATTLSYTVKYVDKDTKAELASEKVVNGRTFNASVTEDAISIDGYTVVGDASKTITITAGTNEIVFEYAKRTDLSYTVKYIDKDTKAELASNRVVNGQTFNARITEDAISIDGYTVVGDASKTITITAGTNEIVFEYAKRTDLSYTVKYIDKDTKAELASNRVVNGQTFNARITEDAISIDGYTVVGDASKTITITAGTNEIVFEYAKRTDLSYTVKYIDKDTKAELASNRVVNGQTFNARITEDAISIDGYTVVGDASKTITITAGTNEIVFEYAKRTDLSYTVKYIDKDTKAELASNRVVNGQTFNARITENAISIDNYTIVGDASKTITITAGTNEIIFEYAKATQYKITIHYVDDATTSATIKEDTVIEGKHESDEYNVNEKIPARIGNYVKESVTGDNAEGTVGTRDVTITVVYTKDVLVDPTVPKPAGPGDNIPDKYQVTINYVDDNTGRGKITGLTTEVKTIRDESSNPVKTGKVTASGSTATANGSRDYFSSWTNDAKIDTSTAGAALGEQTFTAEGGKTYTFTANFGYSGGGGSGGSSRPSTPPTVDIPDDVPTGLNGKDHYAYIIGYGNNDVRPQNNITRAEVATIFFRLLTDETRTANMTKSNSYNDVKDGDWFCCAVSTLSKMGIIKGYEDGSFKPNDPISRAEFAAIAARFDPDGDKTPATFADVTSHWAKDEISIAANHGWIKGYEDGSFKPDQKITRAETMTLVNRVLNRLPETKDDLHKDMKTWVDNMDKTAWYYLAVQEATNSHYFKNKTGTKFEQWTDLRDTRDWSELEK